MFELVEQRFRARQRLGKYRIEGLLARGGYADVYRARDEIEGIRVALKVPRESFATGEQLDDLLREVRLGAGLQHPNILPVKNAEFVRDRLVIAYRLGRETLAERLTRRLATRAALAFAEQLLEALAFAHAHRVIHCDVKPENLILMPEGELRLTDFGIARAARRTLHDASGSGTVGYLAPEQAMGKLSFRSDVFSAGLVIYRTLSGELPEWPFEWPPHGHDRLARKVHRDTVQVLRRSIAVDARERFADAGAMLRELRTQARLQPRKIRRRGRRARRHTWRRLRHREYLKTFRREMPHTADCGGCGGPLSSAMKACPWCGRALARIRDDLSFPGACRRCSRGRKSDWKYCPWCWGPAFKAVSTRRYSDRRYTDRCQRPGCRQDLMPFMRYCPWCHGKVRKAWPLEGSRDRCGRCGWGVTREFWSYCPWCTKTLV